jgi:hypothetical protein
MTTPDSPGRDAARAAKEVLRQRIGDDPRVNGVGIARSHGRYAVRVNVVDEGDLPDLPDEVEGVEVRIVVVGRVVPFDEPPPN